METILRLAVTEPHNRYEVHFVNGETLQLERLQRVTESMDYIEVITVTKAFTIITKNILWIELLK